MPLASCLSAIAAASIGPDDSGYDGTQSQETRNSRLAEDPRYGSSPHSAPPAVCSIPPASVSPPPAEAIAGADANPQESPSHQQISRTRLPSTARAGSLLSHAPASGLPH